VKGNNQTAGALFGSRPLTPEIGLRHQDDLTDAPIVIAMQNTNQVPEAITCFGSSIKHSRFPEIEVVLDPQCRAEDDLTPPYMHGFRTRETPGTCQNI